MKNRPVISVCYAMYDLNHEILLLDNQKRWKEKIKETIWYIPYNLILEKYCIRKEMSKKKHQLYFAVPTGNGCSMHLFVK